MGEPARYLYAVCRGLEPSALDGVPALGGGGVELVEVLDLQAAVSTVDLDEFGEEAMRTNLEHLPWLEQVARGHDAVVQACSAAAPTAPMRLATVCLDDASVRERLGQWYDDLAAALDRVTGRAEWSVKVFTHRRQEQAAQAEPALAGGAAYLRRKKALAEERRTAEVQATTAAEEVDLALREVAVAARRLRPQDPKLSGHEGTMVLNGAYLVDEVRAGDFTRRVADLVAQHPQVSVSCGGPWPPYSFATLEQQ